MLQQHVKINYSSELDFEADCIKIQTTSLGKVFVAGLYRSPSGCINTFCDKFDLLLKFLFSKKQKFILIGDININVLDHTDPKTQRLRDILDSFNLNWSVNEPTRVTATSSTAIDNVITNISNTSVHVFNPAISDHFAQEVVANGCRPKPEPPVFKFRRALKPHNIHQLNRCLEDENWHFLNQIESADEQFKAFYNCLTFYLDIACPLRRVKETSDSRPHRKTWITRGILVSREKLKFYHSIFIKSNDDNFRTFYKNYKRIYKKVIRAAKAYDISRTLKEAENFSKTAWTVINNFTKKTNPLSKQSKLEIEINDNITNEPEVVANEFNRYFASVASDHPSLKRFQPSGHGPVSSMALAPVNEEEVARVVQGLKAKKTCDTIGMSVWLLKRCFKHILTPLTKLINSSFEQGIFPSILKLAKVIPIFKKGDPLQPGNYRPISILPVLSKVYEKVFLERMMGFLDQFDLIDPQQFGFRKNRSTIDAITELVESVVDGLDRREHVLSIFLDLSKAFDCVHHETLLLQLESHGIRGLPLQWLSSYLEDRQQSVQITDVMSEKLSMPYGVPQGSILGPALFVIYVNNLKSSSQNGRVVKYADDTTLCISSKTFQDLEIDSVIELNSCIQHFSEINLKTNESKSNVIKFSLGRQENVKIPCIFMDDVVLDVTDSTIFLGMHLDQV